MREIILCKLFEGGNHLLAIALQNSLTVCVILCATATSIHNQADHWLKNAESHAEKYICESIVNGFKSEVIINDRIACSRPRHYSYEKELEDIENLRLLNILVKTVATIIPELPSLQLTDDLSGSSRFQLPLAMLRPWMYVFLGLVVLVVGIVWLVRAVRYVNGLRRDSSLCDGIRRYFEENVASEPGLMAAIRMRKVLFLIGFAALSSITFTLDGLNVLPNVISAVFLFFAFLMLLQKDKRALPGMILSVITGGFSIGNLFVQIPYFSEYTAQDSYYITAAANMYGPVRICGMLEFFLLLLSFVWLIVLFCRAVKADTAYIGILGAEHKPQYNAEARRQEMYRSVLSRMIAAGVTGVIYFGMEIASYTVSVHYPEFWIATFAVSIVWVVMVIRAMVGAFEDVYQRLEQNY